MVLTPAPGTVLPGAAVTLTWGKYILELDMVKGHVAWFKDKGSRTCLAPVQVTAPPGPQTPRTGPPQPNHAAASA